jgi:sporulation protein YlmC with PRC-barrel domain
MAHYGTLGTQRFEGNVDDIRGADIYGTNDEKLGEIKDVIFDHETGNIQYVVVDTGGWLSSRKFLVPGNRISERSGHDNDFVVPLTREQVEGLPAYDDKVVENEEQFRDYETNYRKNFVEGPVLHKEGSTHVLTPEADEMPAASNSGGIDVTPDRIADPFGSAAPDPSKIRMRPSGTAARVEDTKRPGVSQETREAGWEQPEASSRVERDNKIIEQNNNVEDRSTVRDFQASGDVDDIGYGDINRTAAPKLEGQYPPSYADTVDGSLDDVNDLHRPYPVEEGRRSRFQSFEDHLRRNRVDITSSCRSCDVKKDKAA